MSLVVYSGGLCKVMCYHKGGKKGGSRGANGTWAWTLSY